jgi:hypothetical protein
MIHVEWTVEDTDQGHIIHGDVARSLEELHVVFLAFRNQDSHAHASMQQSLACSGDTIRDKVCGAYFRRVFFPALLIISRLFIVQAPHAVL